MVAGMNQLSMNWNLNPNMWSGMNKGIYSRSTYLPDFVYNFLKTNATTNSDSTFNFKVIFSTQEWPIEGTQFTLAQL